MVVVCEKQGKACVVKNTTQAFLIGNDQRKEAFMITCFNVVNFTTFIVD